MDIFWQVCDILGSLCKVVTFRVEPDVVTNELLRVCDLLSLVAIPCLVKAIVAIVCQTTDTPDTDAPDPDTLDTDTPGNRRIIPWRAGRAALPETPPRATPLRQHRSPTDGRSTTPDRQPARHRRQQ